MVLSIAKVKFWLYTSKWSDCFHVLPSLTFTGSFKAGHISLSWGIGCISVTFGPREEMDRRWGEFFIDPSFYRKG